MAEPRTNLPMADFCFFGILNYSTISENKITVQGVSEGGQLGPFLEVLKQHFLQMYGKV